MAEWYKSQAWLTRRYVTQRRSIESIALECKTTTRTIYNWLKKFGLV